MTPFLVNIRYLLGHRREFLLFSWMIPSSRFHPFNSLRWIDSRPESKESTSRQFLVSSTHFFYSHRTRNHYHIIGQKILLWEGFDLRVRIVVDEDIQLTIRIFLVQCISDTLIPGFHQTYFDLWSPLHQSNWRNNDKRWPTSRVIRHKKGNGLDCLSHAHLVSQ